MKHYIVWNFIGARGALVASTAASAATCKCGAVLAYGTTLDNRAGREYVKDRYIIHLESLVNSGG